jgi:hypothetical protein
VSKYVFTGGDTVSENASEPLSTRTVVISFPDGQSQYWLTDIVFTVGDTIKRDARSWIVADVLTPARSGGYLKVRLHELEEAAAAV